MNTAMDEKIQLTPASHILIGAPRTPPRKKRIKQLFDMLSDLDAVREAHLPEVMKIGSAAPAALVLFLVVDPESEIPAVMETVTRRLKGFLARSERLDVRPISTRHELLPTIKEVDCVIGWRD